MKIGSAVLGVHVAVLCVFALTQGCVTSESAGSGRGAGARHKGPWKHEYKKKADTTVVATQPDSFYNQGIESEDNLYASDMVITSSEMGSTIEPYPEAASSEPTEIYIVKKGDMLSQLAVDFDTTTATLVQMNGLSNPDVLYTGQELAVPAGRGGSSKGSAPKSSSSIKKGGSYTIQKGDTLSGIAVAAGVSINDLRSVNHIQGDKIMAGESIDIPSYGKVPSKTQKSSSSSRKNSAPAPVEPAPVAAEPAPAPAPVAVVEPQVDTIESTSMSVDMIEEKMLYPGETLDDVARQYGVSKAELMRLNNISDESQIREGQRLRIPIAE